jgi:hypothetical protein
MTDKWIEKVHLAAESVLYPRMNNPPISTYKLAKYIWKLCGEILRVRHQNKLLAEQIRFLVRADD